MERWISLDQDIARRLTGSRLPGRLFAALARSGDSYIFFLLCAAGWLFGASLHPAIPALSLFVLSAILVTALIVLALKWIFRRERPAGNWGGVYRRTDPHSFPSGHASRVALLAVLSLGGPWWLSAAAFLWAFLVSLSRILMGVHYPSDVLAGFLLGCLLGAAFLYLRPCLGPYMV